MRTYRIGSGNLSGGIEGWLVSALCEGDQDGRIRCVYTRRPKNRKTEDEGDDTPFWRLIDDFNDMPTQISLEGVSRRKIPVQLKKKLEIRKSGKTTGRMTGFLHSGDGEDEGYSFEIETAEDAAAAGRELRRHAEDRGSTEDLPPTEDEEQTGGLEYAFCVQILGDVIGLRTLLLNEADLFAEKVSERHRNILEDIEDYLSILAHFVNPEDTEDVISVTVTNQTIDAAYQGLTPYLYEFSGYSLPAITPVQQWGMILAIARYLRDKLEREDARFELNCDFLSAESEDEERGSTLLITLPRQQFINEW